MWQAILRGLGIVGKANAVLASLNGRVAAIEKERQEIKAAPAAVAAPPPSVVPELQQQLTCLKSAQDAILQHLNLVLVERVTQPAQPAVEAKPEVRGLVLIPATPATPAPTKAPAAQ